MSCEGQRRANHAPIDRKKRLGGEVLTAVAACGLFGVGIAHAAQPDMLASVTRPIVEHFDGARPAVVTPTAETTPQSILPSDPIRQHRIRHLVASIAETIASREAICGGMAAFEVPRCALTTNAYEEPLNVVATYNTNVIIDNPDESAIQTLSLESLDCSVSIAKNENGEYQTIQRSLDSTAQSVGYGDGRTFAVPQPVSDTDIQCIANIDRLFRALPNEEIDYLVAGTYYV